MFIIFVIFLTTVFANSYEKYIDLLPDEEKQEFLDHVARRVLENVESKEEDSPKTKFSIELTDEQLKEHNDFVQAILKQESEQMRRSKAESSNNKDLKYDEDLKVKPLREDTVSEKEEKSNSSSPQVKPTSDDAGTENSTVSTDETATQNVTIQKRSIQSDESDEKKITSAEGSTKFKDLTKNEPVPTVSSLNADESKVTEAAILQGNFRRSLDASYSEESETTPNDTITTETPDEVITTTETIETQISTTTTISPEQKSQLENNTNIRDSEISKGVSFRVEESEEESTTQTNSNENSDEKSTNAETETTSVGIPLSSTLPNESTTEAVTEMTTVVFKAHTDTTQSNLNEDISTTVSSLVDTVTTDNIRKENETTTENIVTEALEITTESFPGVTPAVIKIDLTKKPTKSKSKLNKTKTVENSSVSSDVKKVNDNKQKVKEKEEEKNFALIQKNVFQKALDDHEGCGIMNMSCNRYRVYEVHWPVSAENESPFLRSKKPMIDSSYFVPIYNYSPNNAYYNPQNRRGPNSDENSMEQQQLREGQNSNGLSEFQINLDGLMSKFGKYNKNTDKDKLTELVNTLKAEDKPKGLETDHLDQYFRLKGGLKNKIREIRDVLFKNKQLENHNRLKKDTSNEAYKGPKDRDISMDYFYGRSKPNAEFDVINLPGKLDSDFLHSLFNGHDLLKVISVKKPIKKNRNRDIKPKKRNKNIKFVVENDRILNEPKGNLDYIRHKDEKSEIVAKNNDAKFESYMNALKELIVQDNNALKQYDWLSTTVQIHAALSKLIELVTRVQNSDPVHPADLQILKYITFLYNFATEIRHANHYGNKLRKNFILPNRKRKHKFNVMKKREMIDKVWLYLRTLMPDLTDQEGLANLKQVLLDVEDGLFDLHDAIRNIATITKFKNQNWYKNLKDLYLSTEEKQLKEVLLHISFARLTDLVEFSCHNGVEEDFVEYMKKHKDIAKKTLEEVLFVIKITDEINNSPI